VAGLLGIGAGSLFVERSFFQSFRDALMESLLHSPDGRVLTLSTLTGLSYTLLALGIALGTAVAVLLRKRRGEPVERPPLKERLLHNAWKPWQAGAVIGLLAVLAYPSSMASGRNYPLGVASGVIQTQWLLFNEGLVHRYQPDAAMDAGTKVVEWWEVLLVFSVVAGAWISGRLSSARFLRKSWDQLWVAFLGGALMRIGVALGFGCTIGHLLSGTALMSVGSIVFGASLMLSGWIATYLYLIGPSALKSRR
jgi:uncharacterized membrane protein YedE/YeeE